MRFVIALMCQNEEPWLRLHIPHYQRANIDGIVALDGGSTDGTVDYLKRMGVHVEHHPFDTPGKQQNRLIELVERLGYDIILHTAPDECWHIDHINQMPALLRDFKALAFPTYNFIKDRRHYAPCAPYYPDPHFRAWRLNEGVRYKAVDYHAGLNCDTELGWRWRRDSEPTLDGRDMIQLSHIHLYHYGDTKPREQRVLLYLNHERRGQGLPPLDALPDGHSVGGHVFHVPFTGEQPIAPEIAEEILAESAVY